MLPCLCEDYHFQCLPYGPNNFEETLTLQRGQLWALRTLFQQEEHHEHLRISSFLRGEALLGTELEALHVPGKYITNKALLSAHVLFLIYFKLSSCHFKKQNWVKG